MASSSEIVLITGANTGLGLETVKALLRSSKGYTILLGGRSLEKANAALKESLNEYPKSPSTIHAVQIDIEDDSSIQKLKDHVVSQFGHVDVLINNAGAQFDPQFHAGKMGLREMWVKSWNVNTVSTYVMTDYFAPLLLKSANPRLLFITSGTSTLAESGNTAVFVNRSPEKGWPKNDGFPITAYRSSKTGMNMMMREWVRILKNDNVKIWCISPGQLATGLGVGKEANKKFAALDPSIGANFICTVVEGARDDDVGKVIRKDDVQPF